MKSNELKLNEALEQLKKTSPSKYKEVCAKLPTLFPNIEAQVKCVEEALKLQEANPMGLTDIEEAKRDYPLLFGVEARTGQTITETAPKGGVKHNGASDNFVEGSPFNEGRTPNTEANKNTRKDIFTKGDRLVAESLFKLGKITEVEKNKMIGEEPAEVATLTEKQQKEYRFARMIGISEADAIKVAKI